MYVTMIQAPHLHLHIGAVRRVHSTFTSVFSVETHKLEAVPKSTGKIPDDEMGV
jgi:hypothetical protein